MKNKVSRTAIFCGISLLSIFTICFTLNLINVKSNRIDSSKKYYSTILKDDKGEQIGIMFKEN